MQTSLKVLLGAFFIALVSVLPGCAVVGGIFKAGVWVGVVAVVLVLLLIIFLVTRGSKK